MFFCKPCGVIKGWQDYSSLFSSYGPCEICGKTRECSDVPSKYLPMPKPESNVK